MPALDAHPEYFATGIARTMFSRRLSSPPPTLPLHILRTDFYPDSASHAPSHFAHEDFSPTGMATSPLFSSRDETPSPPLHKRRLSIQNKIRHTHSPSYKSQKTEHRRRVTFTPSSSSAASDSEEAASGSDSDTTEDTEDEQADDDDDTIPKPEGEAGRPGRGGYNLEETLNWEGREFIKLKSFVHRPVEKNLNVSKTYTKQSLASIKQICTEATERFPVLSLYTQCWPVTDILKLHLKYTTTREKRKAEKKRLSNAQKAIEVVDIPTNKKPLKKTRSKKSKISTLP